MCLKGFFILQVEEDSIFCIKRHETVAKILKSVEIDCTMPVSSAGGIPVIWLKFTEYAAYLCY